MNNNSSEFGNSFKTQNSKGNNEDEITIINKMLLHNCRNTHEISFVSTAQRMSIPCRCSHIENLIRFSSYIIPESVMLI